jgi:LysM repeat protein
MEHPNTHIPRAPTVRRSRWTLPGVPLRTLLPSVRLAVALAAFMVALFATHPAFAQEKVHVVARGENLSTIARSYGLSLQELAGYNGIVNPNLVYVGQQIVIPSSGMAPQTLAPAAVGELPNGDGYYTVARGDTLSQVAKNYGMTTADLMRLNGVANPNSIWVGQQLRVSARVAPAAGAAPERQPELTAADSIYVVQAGDTLAAIASRQQTTVQALLAANGLPNPNFVYAGQRLRVQALPQESSLSLVAAPVDGKRWIEINLSDQTLTAWQGDATVMYTSISSGKPGTPTVTGRFAIGNKYRAQRMTGPDYDLPGVPWVMYFHGAYAIHGAYWHVNFGVPISHGCINMRIPEAEMLYEWAPAGTEVYVHY